VERHLPASFAHPLGGAGMRPRHPGTLAVVGILSGAFYAILVSAHARAALSSDRTSW
jgi:hypothetical protein